MSNHLKQRSNGVTNTPAQGHGSDAEQEAQQDIEKESGQLAGLEERQTLLGESREGGKAATEAYRQEKVDRSGHRPLTTGPAPKEADQETACHIDDKRSPRKTAIGGPQQKGHSVTRHAPQATACSNPQ